MIKSKIIDSFFKWKACDEYEKKAFTSTTLEKFHENPRIEEIEKQLSKVPRVTYNEFEKSLELIRGCILKFDNTHQIKLIRYKGHI